MGNDVIYQIMVEWPAFGREDSLFGLISVVKVYIGDIF